MKLRFEKRTVKVRLSLEEIDTLNSERSIFEKLHISNDNEFSYSVQVVDHQETCSMDFDNNSLKICMPIMLVDKWKNSNQIGIKETIETDQGESVILIVEEDLPPRKNREKK
jgi:hypothetical protein